MIAHSATDSTAMHWARLLRIPAVFTAVADVSMGYLVADGEPRRPWLWLSLAGLTSCFYLAGMVLNDLFDYPIDCRQRPDRPLPSGQISRRQAATVGGLLLLVGVISAWPIGWASQSAAPIQFTAGPISVALGISILFYDGLFKQSVFGPLFMGGCRFLNVLLGIGVTQDPALFQTATPWIVAGGIGVYTMGITWFARHESHQSPRPILLAGLSLMVLGVAVLSLLPSRGDLPHQRVVFSRPWVWPLMLWLLTSPVWRRALSAIASPRPERVQATIRQALMALIVVDAAIVLFVAGPIVAVAILMLMIPSAVLGRWISVT